MRNFLESEFLPKSSTSLTAGINSEQTPMCTQQKKYYEIEIYINGLVLKLRSDRWCTTFGMHLLNTVYIKL